MGIFSKSNIDNYNNKLEKILENKKFTSETKNLLLSMLYKIENAYTDYKNVKVVVDSKEEFIEKILYIIENKCEKIDIVTPKTNESKILEEINKNYLIDEDLGTILVYANEKDLLFSIININNLSIQKDFQEKNLVEKLEEEEKYMYESLKNFLVIGDSMNKSEIIRDFNGWSWNSNTKEIEEININILYQDLILLLGNNFYKNLLNYLENDKEIEEKTTDMEDLSVLNENYEEDTKEEFKENITEFIKIIENSFNKVFIKQRISKLIMDFYVVILAIEANKNQNIKLKIEKTVKEKKEIIELMNNKTKFLNEITQLKKKISKEIEKIDKILNNKELLKEEYEKRNAKLENKYKIFSISHLATRIEHERKENIDKLKKYNKMLEPAEYIKTKERLDKEYKYLEEVLNFTEKEEIEKLIINIQSKIIKCIKIQLENADSKQELIKWFYKIRYYCLLPINSNQYIKDIPQLNKDLKEVINILIDKSIDKNIIENISNSISLCYTTLKYIFETKIIDLKDICIKIVKENESINLEKKDEKEKIYDIAINLYDNKEENETHKEQVDNLTLLNIKLNKKIILFI